MYCSKCGEQLNKSGVCPKCSALVNPVPNQPAQETVPEVKKNGGFKKVLKIFGIIIASIVVLFVIIWGITSLTSKKMVCKSDTTNITIYYNDKTITGYVVTGGTFDLDEQKAYAESVGIESYLTEFIIYFSTNTNGTCTR